MCVPLFPPLSPPKHVAYTFLHLTVSGLPADVVAASLDIDQSEVENTSKLVGTLHVPLPVTILPPRFHRFLITSPSHLRSVPNAVASTAPASPPSSSRRMSQLGPLPTPAMTTLPPPPPPITARRVTSILTKAVSRTRVSSSDSSLPSESWVSDTLPSPHSPSYAAVGVEREPLVAMSRLESPSLPMACTTVRSMNCQANA